MEIHEREQIFREDLSKFIHQFDLATLTEFYDYWTEPTRTGKKMRFELEKTWDISRRLKRWVNNKNLWHGQKSFTNSNTASKLGTSAARIEALRNWGLKGF